jgi:hypothetical protein
MAKNVNETEKQVNETIEATVESQGEPATTETEPKKEGLVARAKKKASGLFNKEITFTPKGVLLGIGKGALAVAAIGGAFVLGKRIQEQTDNAFLETDFTGGEEPVAELPDNIVEEEPVEFQEEVYEEPIEE